MLHLTNMSNCPGVLEWFDHDPRQVREFLGQHRLDGLEVIFFGDQDAQSLPRESIQGIHMSFWPMWLDFWRGDRAALLQQFQTLSNIELFYGGLDREVMLERYRSELRAARTLGAEYVVFHVSHVQMDHIFDWQFTYTDAEVLEAAAEVIENVFGSEDAGVTLLLENLWWPGLTLADQGAAARFLQGISYPRKGIMLDLGHLMLTNPRLDGEASACSYVLNVWEGLGELQQYIIGVHLSRSGTADLRGRDLTRVREEMAAIPGIWDRFMLGRQHILQMDQHEPFVHPCISRVIQTINPRYLVYELEAKNKTEFSQKINRQNQVLGRIGPD